MKKTLATTAMILALLAGLIGAASSATAHPTKRVACTGCHAKSTAVKIAVTQTSQTATTTSYSVKVTGGSGTAGWAVLSGGTNIKHKTASTGTFTVPRGATYKVWAVKKGSGAKSKTLVVN